MFKDLASFIPLTMSYESAVLVRSTEDGRLLFHPGDRYMVWLCALSLYIKMRVFEVYKKH